MDFTAVLEWIESLPAAVAALAGSPELYEQLALIAAAFVLAFALAAVLRRAPGRAASRDGSTGRLRQALLGHAQALLLPLLTVALMGGAVELATAISGQSWFVRIGQGLAAVWLLHAGISRFVARQVVRVAVSWIAIPIALLQVFGWLAPTAAWLESLDVQIGNIQFSAYGLLRVLIFGSLLFWLGRVSNNAGQSVIRNQQELDVGTRELFAKLFEAALYMVVFILLLQIMGINLTALAVFGGALGVGLGFGLQSIASNFISGIILLLDRSLRVGDYVELESGQKGNIVSMNMRSTTLETFEGKVIVVPNESFITGSFVNWTHNNEKQRYSIEFQVAYSTDLEMLFEVLRRVVASHPQVISGDDVPVEERPDAEIAGFGDSGVDILIEFWMAGIDDGRNRVGADLYMMIWKALKENGVEIPFPQREVRLLGEQAIAQASTRV
ncbi:MAG TPA: mechanosensitive ion channel domain-containing protein [Gammaproteobacteria bacterium]|nr:mechanosensitive ion channel domain-containing protein [Gammaproteobacteria bacterium]